MKVTTYVEIFQRVLEEWIAAGGDVSRVVTLVNVYQKTDSTARHFAFREWLQGQEFPCGRCGSSFRPAVEETEEQHDVLCQWCGVGFLGLGREPVAGWRRTWAR